MSLSVAYNGLISGHLHLFGTGVDYYVFRFICERTLRFDKISERIPVDQFERGIPGITLGLPFSRQSIHKARRQLRNRGLIFYRDRPDGRCDYSVNVFAIWYAIKKIYQDISCISQRIVEILEREARNLIEAIKPKFDKRGAALVAKYKQKAEEGLRQSAQFREKRVKKKPGLQVQKLPSYFRDLCAEYEIEYSGEAWTKKLMRQARMFIDNDCHELEKDPKELFRTIVENWSMVRRSLKDDFGKPLFVPTRFTFSFFYSHRRRMLDAIFSAKRRRSSVTYHFTKD